MIWKRRSVRAQLNEETKLEEKGTAEKQEAPGRRREKKKTWAVVRGKSKSPAPKILHDVRE